MQILFCSVLNYSFLLQAQWMLYSASIFGVIVMRIRQPSLVRPFKVFIGIPIIMFLIALTLVIVPFFQVSSSLTSRLSAPPASTPAKIKFNGDNHGKKIYQRGSPVKGSVSPFKISFHILFLDEKVLSLAKFRKL